MTVIAFRPRRNPEAPASDGDGIPLTGTFRSPRGDEGVMTGHLRLHRLVLVPRGAFVTGVFTGELREPDGTVVGRESRRTTAAADLVRDELGLHPVVRPLELDLMGFPVRVHSFAIEPGRVFPSGRRQAGQSARHTPRRARGEESR
jgi:hypothetical protein